MESTKATKKSWIAKLFADGTTDTVSSKRVMGVLSFIVLVILAFFSAFDLSPTTDVFYIFAGLAGGQSFLTTLEKIAKRSTTD